MDSSTRTSFPVRLLSRLVGRDEAHSSKNDEMRGRAEAVRSARMPPWRQRVLLRLLNEYRHALAAEGKERAADAVVDVMDMVTGWCSPHMRLSNFTGSRRGGDAS